MRGSSACDSADGHAFAALAMTGFLTSLAEDAKTGEGERWVAWSATVDSGQWPHAKPAKNAKIYKLGMNTDVFWVAKEEQKYKE